MLDTLVTTYRVHLEAEGKSPKTIEWHRYSLAKFAAWLHDAGHPENPAEWTPAMIRSYLVALRGMPTRSGKPLAPHSVKSYHSSLRSFCAWLHAEEFTDRDVMERVKQPAVPKLAKPSLSPDEIRRVLSATKAGGRHAIRDEALILFLLDTGARANEVCTLRMVDVGWEQRVAKLFGKGAKERFVPFSAQTMKAMQRYALKARRGGTDRFFESDTVQPLTRSGLLQLCRRIGDRAGVELNPHKFRHTFAITSLRSGASVFAVQKMLGHTSLDVTLRYAHLVTDDIVNEHRKHSPVDRVLRDRARG